MIVAATILSRFAWIVPATYLPRLLLPSLRRRDPYPPAAVPIVMSWAGMRGVVSLAAALALPDHFPGRDFIIATSFLVILVTVLIQGATLASLVRALGLSEFKLEQRSTLSEDEARARMAQAQLAAVERHSLNEDGTHRHPRLVEQYGYRARATARFSEAGGALIDEKNAHFATVLAAVAAGRDEVLRLYQAGEVHDSVLHTLEGELDLQEVEARRHHGD
jgi:CPA1 family monovalent cation:H+ antiporter